VKGFALDHPDEVELGPRGVVANRRFYLAEEDGRRLRSSQTAWPVRFRARYDPTAEHLEVTLPDGGLVEGSTLKLGRSIVSDFFGRRVEAHVVDGPWTEPLSAAAGRPVVLARPAEPGECLTEPVTLMSTASLARLDRAAGTEVDGRRFRMLFTLDGCGEHEEDEWEGRVFRIGDARIRVGGPVDRCAVTTRDPDTGVRDLDTLRVIRDYRGARASDGKSIDFGVYAQVVEPGPVRLGDAVTAE
jgi:uncharacterized protein YcbX